MLKNYIFDFGNVIANFYPDKLTGCCVSDPKLCTTLSGIVFDRLYWDRLDDGTITDEEVKNAICKRVPDGTEELACRVYDSWINNLTPINDICELIYDIRQNNGRLYLLSNISKGFADGYANVKWIKDVLDNFDGLVMSGTVGLTKPNNDIYEYLLNKYSLKAGECVFVDDSSVNIEGAKKAGINGYLFDGDIRRLRDYLGL